MAKKFSVYRKGGQISSSVYADDAHRTHCLNQASILSPFSEEILDDNKKPIGLMVFNPMKADVEKSEPGDVFDVTTLKDSDAPKGSKVPVWSPVISA